MLARATQVHFSNDVETEFVLKNLIQQQSNGYIFALEAKTNVSSELLQKDW